VLLHVVARGRIGRGPEAELVERYLKRVAWPVRMTELPDKGGNAPARESHSKLVMLDETGENLPSRILAERLGQWRDDGVR